MDKNQFIKNLKFVILIALKTTIDLQKCKNVMPKFWLKCLKCSAVSTVTKNTNSFMSIKLISLIIFMQIIPDLLNNFTKAAVSGLLWLKSLNYAVKLIKSAAQSVWLQKTQITSRASD